MNTGVVWVICPLCGAASLGAPPHGQQGQPCPTSDLEQRRRDEANVAYVEKLNAERDSALRTQMAMLDSKAMMDEVKKMFLDKGDDDA